MYHTLIHQTNGDEQSQDPDYCSPTQRVSHSQSSDSSSPSSDEVAGFEFDKEVEYDFTRDDQEQSSQVKQMLPFKNIH
jgi:hypothetical protein